MDGIMDIDGHHPTKWIVTKQMGQSIIMTLRGTYILKWRSDAMMMIRTHTLTMMVEMHQMTMIIMNLNPKIPIP
jgi:hypothetical protein